MGANFSFPYGSAAQDPFWGVQTSAVNFCEDDYIMTRYLAEFINTLSSGIYLLYGAHGILRRRPSASQPSAFSPVNWPYWGLIGVGLFSATYHATLKYHTQMADELSMHLAIGTVMLQVFNYQQSPSIQRRNTALLLSVLVPFYIYHCVADEFVLHVILFMSMTITVVVKTNKIIAAKNFPETDGKALARLAHVGAACAAGGYGIWNVDVHFCSTLTGLKRQVGLPWGAVLEFHGWWHVLTGIGAYIFMALIEFLTTPEVGGRSEKKGNGGGFAWPVGGVLRTIGTGSRGMKKNE